MNAPYNTVEGIRSYLVDLEGLRRLVVDRMEAQNTRHERLRSFIILRRWVINYTLNRAELRDPAGVDMLSSLAPVVSVDAFFEAFDGPVLRTYGVALPRAGEACPGCHGGWTLVNAHDCVVSGEARYHEVCLRITLANGFRERFHRVLEPAFPFFSLSEIPNEYCKCSSCGPWFAVHTLYGIIKIGWRKRVINIDWSGTGASFPDLFQDEDVTHEPNLVHAWGYEKAGVYLARLKQALDGAHRTRLSAPSPALDDGGY